MNLEQAKEKIAHPLIRVEPFDGPKGGHWYRAFSTITGEEIASFSSVTGQLDIIGGGKTHGLMWWAKDTALAKMKELLLQGNKAWNETEISNFIKIARFADKTELKKAGNIGTRVHLLIDAHITNTMPDITDIDEDAKIGFNNFMKFVFENDIKFVQGDTPVISLKYKYGGRLDAIAIIKSELVLLDWKTGNAIRDDAACQTAAYNLAMSETLGIKAKRCIVCRFDKTATGFFEHREVNLKGAEKAWLHAHKLHNAFKAPLLWRTDVKNGNDSTTNQ